MQSLVVLAFSAPFATRPITRASLCFNTLNFPSTHRTFVAPMIRTWSKPRFELVSNRITNRKPFTTVICAESYVHNVKSASLVYDDRHILHDDKSHPEMSARATKMWEALEESGLAQRCYKVSGREATREELAAAHTEEHINLVNQGEALMDGSTYFTTGTPLAARVAAGCVLEMTKQVLTVLPADSVTYFLSIGHHLILHWWPDLHGASSKRNVCSQAAGTSCSSTACNGILHFQQRCSRCS
jgi:hypothetical protein